ncbi:MAG: hypothetical protein GY694_02745 [Gammaproteobacteria bacterium]|nr:hypothetical protein [Gammaproteobacteria bacterium]
MNFVVKCVLSDAIISALITVFGGGNFYSFLFFFALLLIPVISIFVSIDIARQSSKKSSDGDEKNQT